MPFDIALSTHVGGRQPNEDFCTFAKTATGLFLVLADGMGGHQAGELASHYFCEAAVANLPRHDNPFAQSPKETMEELLQSATRSFQEHLAAQHPGVDAHTTCVLAWLDNDRCVVAHVGDSRLYHLTPERIAWRTRDHSIAQLLLDQGEISEEELKTHPDQGALYRSIGPKDTPRPSITLLAGLKPGAAVLVCSDGFWTHAPEADMLALINSNDLAAALDTLVATVAECAGEDGDNVTALCARKQW